MTRTRKLVAALVIVAGIYATVAVADTTRVPSLGVTIAQIVAATTSWTGGVQTFSDEVLKVCDNGDNTKCVEFEASGITTGNTRTLTPPNANATLVGYNVSGDFSTHQGMTASFAWFVGPSGSGVSPGLSFRSEQTPDAPILFTGTASNSWIISEVSDVATDFAHPQQTNPTVFTQSADATQVGQFSSLDYLGVQPSRMTVTVDGATTFAITGGYIVLVCTGAETINTIAGATRAGVVLYIENTDTDCTIADDDSATAANAVDLTGAAANDVGAVAKVITLIYNGTHWLQTAESDN